MIKSDDTSLAVLNTLLAICHDSQQGYEVAAADAADVGPARLLGELGAQRMKFADELTQRVRVLRGEPRKTGTMIGEIHRAWIDFKAGNTRLQAHEILATCEQAEDVATAAYRAALKTADVDELTLKLIQGQYEQVQLAHDRVRDLRDSPAYAAR